MGATESDVLGRLKAIKSGTATPSKPSGGPSTAPADESSTLTRLKAVKAGSASPTAPSSVDSTSPHGTDTTLGTFLPELLGDTASILKAPFTADFWKDLAGFGPPGALTQMADAQKRAQAEGREFDPVAEMKPIMEQHPILRDWMHKNYAGVAGHLAAIPTAAAITSGVLKAAPGIKNIPKTVRTTGSSAADIIGQRAIQSWMPVDEKTLKLGADPVAAVRQLPASTTRQGMLSHIDEAIGTPESGVEGQLIKAIRRREAMAAELPEGYGTGIDVESRLRARLKPLIDEARRHHGDTTATQIQDFVDREISAIKQANGGKSYLDAGQVLAEKRNFGSNVEFGTDTAAITLNKAKQAFYNELDATFDHLVPEAEGLNKFYSGLIEGRRLISEGITKHMNSPVSHETFFSSVASKFPETSIKTAINALVTKKAIPKAGGSSMSFYRLPNPGYLDNPSGVAPTNGITPIKPPPAGAPNQFANPSGVSPRSGLPNVITVKTKTPMSQFEQPSGVAPTNIAPATEYRSYGQFDRPSGVTPNLGSAPAIPAPTPPHLSAPSGVRPDMGNAAPIRVPAPTPPPHLSVPSGVSPSSITPIIEQAPHVPQFSQPSGSAPKNIQPVREPAPKVEHLSKPSGVTPGRATPTPAPNPPPVDYLKNPSGVYPKEGRSGITTAEEYLKAKGGADVESTVAPKKASVPKPEPPKKSTKGKSK